MVLTRSQLKNKAAGSSDPAIPQPAAKQPRKKAAAASSEEREQSTQPAGHLGSAGESLPALALKQLNIKGARASKAARPKQGPGSHPIHSLPSSPSGEPASEFTIPTAPQPMKQDSPAEQHPVPPPAPAAAAAAADTTSIAAMEVDAAPVQPMAASAPAGASSQEVPAPQSTRQEIGAAPSKPVPRGEKLLKPLPDKPVPCDKLPDGPEPVAVEVEYIAREALEPLEDPSAVVESTLAGLESSDWVEATRALNVLRQLAVHHPETISPYLDRVLPAVLKGVKNLRSSLCKTAIMAVADLYLIFGDVLLSHTDVGGQAKPATSLLAQLLLKAASNDKRFVVEEAQRALQTVAESLGPAEALELLLPYAEQHKNPKVRGRAAGPAAVALASMQRADMAAFGLPALLRATARLLTDNTPEAREAAKRLVGLIRVAFDDTGVQQQLDVQVPEVQPAAEGEEAPAAPTKWELYCQQTLGGSAALAVLKASAADR